MTGSVFWLNFLYSLIATVAGGVLLTILFFWFREKIMPIPDVTGRWFFEVCTIKTVYRPYHGMVLRYVAMLWREDRVIKGTVEKIYENSSTGEREYIGSDRTRGIVEGYIQKNYFSKDRVVLHVIENGHGRESTNFYDLVVQSKVKMLGEFSSMVADQDGETTWQREKF